MHPKPEFCWFTHACPDTAQSTPQASTQSKYMFHRNAGFDGAGMVLRMLVSMAPGMALRLPVSMARAWSSASRSASGTFDAFSFLLLRRLRTTPTSSIDSLVSGSRRLHQI